MLVMLRPSPHFRTEPKKEPLLFVVAWSRIRSCYLVLRPSAHRDGVFPDERIVVGYVLKLDYNRSCLAPHEVERITDAQRTVGVVRRLTGVGQRRRVVVAQFHRSCACWPNSGEEFERGRLQLKLTRFWQKSCAIMCVY